MAEQADLAAGPTVRGRSAAPRRRALRLYGTLRPLPYLAIAAALFFLLFFAWWLATRLHLASSFFLPSPGNVAHRTWQLARDGTLWQDTKTSFVRIMIGWLISTAVGIPVGILSATRRGSWQDHLARMFTTLLSGTSFPALARLTSCLG